MYEVAESHIKCATKMLHNNTQADSHKFSKSHDYCVI
jgi:hypothetical protein